VYVDGKATHRSRILYDNKGDVIVEKSTDLTEGKLVKVSDINIGITPCMNLSTFESFSR
jgi:hypothetical protein